MSQPRNQGKWLLETMYKVNMRWGDTDEHWLRGVVGERQLLTIYTFNVINLAILYVSTYKGYVSTFPHTTMVEECRKKILNAWLQTCAFAPEGCF